MENLIIPDLSKAPSTSDVITQYLRKAILNEYFSMDEPIRQDDIAKKFNVSKIPVREALKKLESEGLVIFIKNRGAVVTRMTDNELAQLFEMRILLEQRLLELAIPNMGEQDFAAIEQAYRNYIADQDILNWSYLNWRFHATLYQPANRPLILDAVSSINQKLERYLRMQISLSDGKPRADREHAEIMRLCRRGDVTAAVDLLKAHIYGVCQSLLDNLNGK
ncbi:GntR family transcriptional regulator [Martelella alba]|uniref:GntR family transcriptional regulator n=1 Tax=Martelella alba TaxID=2590451 RepID=A0ABY2SQD8_9HYPH|nr:GntR family transcriptional regulator [Martelella alba]TKI07861.1 GntR family transcriptional regulator [Martelella alba]